MLFFLGTTALGCGSTYVHSENSCNKYYVSHYVIIIIINNILIQTDTIMMF